FEPLGARFGADNWFDDVLQRLPLITWNSPRRVFETRIGDQVGSFQRKRELAPESRVAARREQVAPVAGLEQSVTGDRAERVLRSVVEPGHFLVADDAPGLERERTREQ